MLHLNYPTKAMAMRMCKPTLVMIAVSISAGAFSPLAWAQRGGSAAPEVPRTPLEDARGFVQYLGVLADTCPITMELAFERYRQRLINATELVAEQRSCPQGQIAAATQAKAERLDARQADLPPACSAAARAVYAEFMAHMENFNGDLTEAPGAFMRRIKAEALQIKRAATKARLECEG